LYLCPVGTGYRFSAYMSTTTKEDKPSMLDDLKAQAAELAAKIKAATDAHLETLHTKLQEAHKQVQSLTAEIESHSGKPAPAKRGRKVKNSFPPKASKPAKKSKGKRGAVGEAITAFVSSKGKAGAHLKDIAAATGFKPANITAFFYAKGNAKKFKKVAPATFVVGK
jgi:hypothetical protein